MTVIFNLYSINIKKKYVTLDSPPLSVSRIKAVSEQSNLILRVCRGERYGPFYLSVYCP